jgi:hypothetical protein
MLIMKKNAKKILVKVLALILCGLMLMGTVAAIIPAFTGDEDGHNHTTQTA